MLHQQMRLQSRVQELMIQRLRELNLMGTYDYSPAFFTIALVDAACHRPSTSSELVEVSGTIAHWLQRLNNTAPLSIRQEHVPTMMLPDTGDVLPVGPLDGNVILTQRDALLQHLNSNWPPRTARQLARGDYYRWLAGHDVCGLPKIEVTIRCGDDRTDYGNLAVTLDLGLSSLRHLPEELWKGLDCPKYELHNPTRMEALQRLGHMNSVVICSNTNNFRHRGSHLVPVFDLGRNSTLLSALELVTKLHVPDRHVQPSYRGITSPCAVCGEIDGLDRSLTDNWSGVQVETIDERLLQQEVRGFWTGVIFVVQEKSAAAMVLTTGVTREPAVDWL